jgi:hypothetical protein
MSMVVKEDCGCWRFTGAIGSHGYGYFCWDDKTHLAHRASWEVHRGSIPRGMFVCHRCDNPRCCNPDHLFMGTAKDNSDDMRAKGRGRWQNMEDLGAISLADLIGETPVSISPKPVEIAEYLWQRELYWSAHMIMARAEPNINMANQRVDRLNRAIGDGRLRRVASTIGDRGRP